ncbi:MAG TPA: methyl-accepting chemotaxis protein [Polyangiaceae bacterium]|nr:methyl-accepting chemotaxis protein [Polyangiaceae bacterium]
MMPIAITPSVRNAAPTAAVRRRIVRIGLAAKLLASFAAFFVLAAFAMTILATRELKRTLVADFESRGEAVATGMSATAERSVSGDPLLLSSAVLDSRSLRGVRYIFVQDGAGRVLASSFSEGPPEGLLERSRYEDDPRLPDTKRVQKKRIDLKAGSILVRAIDIALPFRFIDVDVRWGRGQAGSVHVGMDLEMIDNEVRSLEVKMIGVGAAVAIIGILASLFVAMWTVVRPVRELTRVTSAIVAEGDLTQSVGSSANDEIGDLANTFGLMVGRLREISKAIWESTKLLEELVNSLQQSARAQGRTARSQAAALQDTQRAAQEVGSASRLAAQRTAAVLRHAARGEDLGRTAEAAVGRSLEALTDIRGQVHEIALRITGLSSRTVQVGNIAGTVKDLADQSNLLALNAAIEAMRSGEHGKGFGVVAREMRSLADQSIQATKRVRDLLSDTNSATRQAIAITEAGTHRIDAGLSQVKASGEHLAGLSGIVRENSATVREIGVAVSHQNDGILRIAEAINQQSEMMDETIGRLSATEKSVQTIKGVAERLVALVREFRV